MMNKIIFTEQEKKFLKTHISKKFLKTRADDLESVREIQIIEGGDANNIDYIIKLINRMERLVLGKMLNQINTIQSKLNCILNNETGVKQC